MKEDRPAESSVCMSDSDEASVPKLSGDMSMLKRKNQRMFFIRYERQT